MKSYRSDVRSIGYDSDYPSFDSVAHRSGAQVMVANEPDMYCKRIGWVINLYIVPATFLTVKPLRARSATMTEAASFYCHAGLTEMSPPKASLMG